MTMGKARSSAGVMPSAPPRSSVYPSCPGKARMRCLLQIPRSVGQQGAHSCRQDCGPHHPQQAALQGSQGAGPSAMLLLS